MIINNKELLIISVVCGLISLIIRNYFFNEYGTLINDDSYYIPLANNIISKYQITLDGNSPHILFPPGYPFILAIENLIFDDYLKSRKFEYLVVILIIQLIINN